MIEDTDQRWREIIQARFKDHQEEPDHTWHEFEQLRLQRNAKNSTGHSFSWVWTLHFIVLSLLLSNQPERSAVEQQIQHTDTAVKRAACTLEEPFIFQTTRNGNSNTAFTTKDNTPTKVEPGKKMPAHLRFPFSSHDTPSRNIKVNLVLPTRSIPTRDSFRMPGRVRIFSPETQAPDSLESPTPNHTTVPQKKSPWSISLTPFYTTRIYQPNLTDDIFISSINTGGTWLKNRPGLAFGLGYTYPINTNITVELQTIYRTYPRDYSVAISTVGEGRVIASRTLMQQGRAHQAGAQINLTTNLIRGMYPIQFRFGYETQMVASNSFDKSLLTWGIGMDVHVNKRYQLRPHFLYSHPLNRTTAAWTTTYVFWGIEVNRRWQKKTH